MFIDDLKAQLKRRFEEGKADDVEINRDLVHVALGALIQREEAGVLATPEDLIKLAELKKEVSEIAKKEKP